jgi:phosphoribosylamine---glycine ligase
MSRKSAPGRRAPSIMVLGVGAFAHSTAQILADDGARVATWLTRNYGHFPPSLAGPTFASARYSNPLAALKEHPADLLVPMSIDWAQAPWAGDLLAARVPIFCPTGGAMRIERERDFARKLCRDFKIPFPRAHVAPNRLAAENFLKRHPRPYVIKNPLCSPTSPVHTILCETVEDTRSWLGNINYAEGVFLQEYLGRAEAGHIALVSGGQIHSVVTNQEYKRAFDGNMGVVAGAPLGGLVEKDPDDRYGLARELLHPLRPWFRAAKFHGPIQVTAIRRNGRWHVIEYNIRIGVTSGAMLLRMLQNPTDTLLRTGRNQKLDIKFKPGWNFGCSVTLAGYGYPYVHQKGPPLPVEISAPFDAGCDVWWNEVNRDPAGRLFSTGHRIADVVGFGATLSEATRHAYDNIKKIRSLASYYRTDVGRSLWPPGSE